MNNDVLKESPPIEINEEGTVISKLKIHNPGGFAIVIKANNVTIQECDISGSINISGPVYGLTIQNNYIHDIKIYGDINYQKQFSGITTTEGDRWNNPIVQPLGAHKITIIGNYFSNCPSSIFLAECSDVLIKGNYSENCRGPFPRGQFTQMALCNTDKGSIIIEENFSYVDPRNKDQIFYGDDHRGVEDHINCCCSYGSEDKPIIIRNNYITGYSSSDSGSAIMVGDGGGSYYEITGNKVYNTGNAGIGLCGGHHSVINGNRIFQEPATAQERCKGLQLYKFGDDFSAPISIEDNLVYWCCGSGDGSIWSEINNIANFKHNTFGNREVFGELDSEPIHEPPCADEALTQPWKL